MRINPIFPLQCIPNTSELHARIGISFSLYVFEDITGYTAAPGPHTPMMSCSVNAWQDLGWSSLHSYVQFDLTRTRFRAKLHVFGTADLQRSNRRRNMTLSTACCFSRAPKRSLLLGEYGHAPNMVTLNACTAGFVSVIKKQFLLQGVCRRSLACFSMLSRDFCFEGFLEANASAKSNQTHYCIRYITLSPEIPAVVSCTRKAESI